MPYIKYSLIIFSRTPDPNPPICCCQMVGTDMTFLDIIGWFLTLQEAGGIRQPLWREEASLSLCFEEKKKRERKQSGTDLQAVQSCVGLKERGSLSLLKVKIASLPTMTYSHESSTSPTTLPSPPSYTHTQQLFEWSTIGYIQCRYECLKTRMRIKMLQRSWDDIPRCNLKQHCTFLTLRFPGGALQNRVPVERNLPPHPRPLHPPSTATRYERFWPKRLLTVINATWNIQLKKTRFFFFCLFACFRF